MHLRVIAPNDSYGMAFAQVLRANGHEVHTELDLLPALPQHTLHLPATTPKAEALALIRHLLPLPLTVAYVADLDSAKLWLASAPQQANQQVRVCGRDGARSRRLVTLLREMGFDVAFKQTAEVHESLLQHGGIDTLRRGAMAWAMAAVGTPATVCRTEGMKRWFAVLHVQDGTGEVDRGVPEQPGMPGVGAGESRPSLASVAIHTGDTAHAGWLAEHLGALGFRDVYLAPSGHDDSGRRFELTAAVHLAGRQQAGWGVLAEALARRLCELGVDGTAMPLVTATADDWPLSPDPHRIEVHLPTDRLADGGLAPWAGPSPGRFPVTVRAAPEVSAPVALALQHAGFRVETQPLAPVALRPSAAQVEAGELFRHPTLLAAIRDAVDSCHVPGLESGPLGLGIEPDFRGTTRVILDLVRPEEAPSSGQYALRGLNRFQVTLYAETNPTLHEVCTRLRDVAGAEVDIKAPDRQVLHATVRYGGAKPELVQAVADELASATGLSFTCDKAWSDRDLDIWVYLPVPKVQDGVAGDNRDPFVGAWGRAAPQARGFLALTAGSLRVGNVRLARRIGPRHPLAPNLSFARQMCLDAQTAELLEHVASAIAASEPCLLEGPTSATKTSGILALAALLGRPVLRINLSGQTDTSELIGHYVPDPGGGFRWQDGAAVRAVTEGLWLVLDELNLGPPQVVERLNALLEHPASLTLSERDHRTLGSEEWPIHPEFRIFATMNPAEYAGRAALSPAGKDRWIRQLQVAAPDVAAIEAMLRHAAWAEQPALGDWGPAWVEAGELSVALGAQLDADPALLGDFFHKLADLHARVLSHTAMGSETSLGAERREGYIFTRRGLLALVQRLQQELHSGIDLQDAMRIALRQAYVDRVAMADRPVLALLMDAVGLGPRTWLVGQPLASQNERDLGALAEAA
ncbi:MAG: AAA family ATPase [Myxococcota bacterium]